MEWVVITFGGEKRSEGSNFVEWYIGSVPNQSDGDVAGRHMQLDKSSGISLLIFSNFRSNTESGNDVPGQKAKSTKYNKSKFLTPGGNHQPLQKTMSTVKTKGGKKKTNSTVMDKTACVLGFICSPAVALLPPNK